jgi:selenide,water dikinase
VARGSDVALTVRFADLPFLSDAEHLAQQNFVTGASNRNWASYAESINLPANLGEWQRQLLTDPQTSGGLLVACDQNRAVEVTKLIADRGYPHARIIGHAFSGRPAVTVE